MTQGRQKVLERDDPLGLAADFSRYGEIALIDLDAAMGEGDNGSLVREICRTAECRVGGGIRSIDKARRLVEHGAAKVIVGTRAFREDGVDQEFLSELARAVGRERVVIALDNVRGRSSSTAGGGTRDSACPPSSKRRRPSPRSSCSPGWSGKA